MTPQECRDTVIELFQRLYPGCTVIYSYPGFSARPPLPYIVLEFGAEEIIAQHQSVKDGILQQAWQETIPFTAEMADKSRTVHDGGVKKVLPPTVVDDLGQSARFFESPYADDTMRAKNIRISLTAPPTPVFNAVPGVERAQCSFSADFVLYTSEYAALSPRDWAYSADRKSAASKELAEMEAGYFTEAEVICADEEHKGSENE